MYYVYWIKVPNTELYLATEDMAIAVDEARKLHAGSTAWERVEIRSMEGEGNIVPYRLFVTDRGNVVDEIKGCVISEAIGIAERVVENNEHDDKVAGNYEVDRYDIINEFGESYIRLGSMKKS